MKTIIGTYLIDAPFSALNNRGIDQRAANENEVATKVIQSPEGIRPYVSAQALRYWWRMVLENKFGWKCSPVEKIGKNQAFIIRKSVLISCLDTCEVYSVSANPDVTRRSRKGFELLVPSAARTVE